MALVNRGYLHCTDKEILINSSLKATKKLAMVLSKIQVSDPGPSWPSCCFFLFSFCFIQQAYFGTKFNVVVDCRLRSACTECAG